MRMTTIAATVAALFAGAALAEVPVEQAKLGKSRVTLAVHPFLSDEELMTLRLVMTNRQALSVFLPGKPANHSALAVSPDEGFIRKGKPVPSAIAVADLPEADVARQKALEGCDGARKTRSAACVIVLEVGPAGKK